MSSPASSLAASPASSLAASPAQSACAFSRSASHSDSSTRSATFVIVGSAPANRPKNIQYRIGAVSPVCIRIIEYAAGCTKRMHSVAQHALACTAHSSAEATSTDW